MKQAKATENPSAYEQGRARRWDVLLVCGVLAVCLIACFVVYLGVPQGERVEVRVDGEVVGIYSLRQSGEYSLNGGTNTLVIADGEAYLTKSRCPDHRCERGHISRRGQSRTCLPNRVQICIMGEGEADFITE